LGELQRAAKIVSDVERTSPFWDELVEPASVSGFGVYLVLDVTASHEQEFSLWYVPRRKTKEGRRGKEKGEREEEEEKLPFLRRAGRARVSGFGAYLVLGETAVARSSLNSFIIEEFHLWYGRV
jgi:hypothetical protein